MPADGVPAERFMSLSPPGASAPPHPRDYPRYLLSRVLAACGSECLSVGVSWQVYQLTGHAFDLGMVGFAQFAPFLLLFLVAGAAADRWPRARILGVCGGVQTLCALLLTVLTWTQTASFPRLLTLLVLLGVARAFQSPASQAILPLLVPPASFARAVAWTTLGTQGARIGGPALAGGLLLLGQAYVYGAAIGCLGLSTVLTWLLRAKTQVVSRERPSLASLLAGAGFIWARPVLLGTITLDLFAVLFGGATALLPIYAVDILHVGAVGFGGLRAGHMLGAMVCTLYLTQRPLQRRAGGVMLGMVGMFGVTVVIFGLSTSFWLSLLALSVMGAVDAVSMFIRSHVVQLIPPDAMRGRVSAVNAVCIGASNELGAFESGLAAAWLGVVPAVVGGGGITLVVTLLCWWWWPQLRAMDSLEQEAMIRQYR